MSDKAATVVPEQTLKPVTLNLDLSQIKRLDEIAHSKRRSRSEVARILLSRLLRRAA